MMVLVGAPAPYLLGPLIGSGTATLLLGSIWNMPDLLRHAGIAVIGAGAGALIDSSALVQVVQVPHIIFGGVVATVIFSLATGLLLVLSPHITLPTALLASLAGAASGVSALARDVDADEVIVAAIQYARVVVVIAAITFAAAVLGGPAATGGEASDGGGRSLLLDSAFVLACAGGALLLAKLLPFTGASLLYSTAFAVIGSSASPVPIAVPEPALNAAYAIVGMAVGLSFTATTMRTLRKIFPLALVQIVISVVGCAALGFLLADIIGISYLSGFLAMSPGGLPTAAAIAVQAGEDVGIVITMQLVRMLAAIVTAVIIGVLLGRRGRGAAPAD